jgi:4,5-dihydroxyphthalate decarboxylase
VSRLPLTLACGDYEIVRAIKEGTVRADGIDLNVLTDMDSTTRHWRFLRNREFDVCELSASSYLVAHDQGLPIEAIPVFLHRRFRHGFVFVNKKAGIAKPADLIGKRVGIKHWQVTAILWMRGILEHEYGVPHRKLKWFQEMDQDVEVELPSDIDLTVLPDGSDVAEMLAEGELDAVIHSTIIEPIVRGDDRVGRLFPDYKAEEVAFYRKTGMFPIMHVTGIKREILEENPWVATNLQRAFDQSKAIAMKRMVNPRLVPLAWYMEQWEDERALLGPDPWEYGLTDRNRKTLENMIGYSHEQGLIRKKPAVDELFVENFQGRGRGGFQI